MELTEVSPYKNRVVSGYMLNAALSSINQEKIAVITDKLKNHFGDLIIEQPGSALHITLMDWVAPLVTYNEDHDTLFEKVFPESDRVLSGQLEDISPFTIHFDTIKVSNAAIFIQGNDNGQMQSIRDDFIAEATLLPGTKQPPKIVHCSIARFDRSVNVAPIKKYIESLSVDFEQQVDSFRLVHEIEMPMFKYDIIKDYILPASFNNRPQI